MAFYKIHDKLCSMFHCHELVVKCSDGLLMASQLHNLIYGNPDPFPFFPFLTCGLRAV